MLGFLKRNARAAWHRVKYTEGYRNRFEFCRPKVGFGLYRFRDDRGAHYSLFFVFVWVQLWRSAYPVRGEMLDSWSVSFRPFAERYVYLSWGPRTKFVELPWSLEWVDTAYLNTSGAFVVCDRVKRNGFHEWAYPELPYFTVPDMLAPASFAFTYTTKRGEVQQTTATVNRVERRRWRWRLFRWLRLPIYKTAYNLDVSFADEMGSERGSWKGGIVGTGCDWKPGESIEAALRRYEAEQNRTHGFCR